MWTDYKGQNKHKVLVTLLYTTGTDNLQSVRLDENADVISKSNSATAQTLNCQHFKV